MDGLLNNMSDGGLCKPLGFADDTGLVFCGSDPNMLVELAQPYVSRAVIWGHENGLQFSPAKTTIVFFNRKYKFDPNKVKCLIIGGKSIKPSLEMMYLGVTLDSKLSWLLHIKRKIDKIRK